jgi:hypothetical protein
MDSYISIDRSSFFLGTLTLLSVSDQTKYQTNEDNHRVPKIEETTVELVFEFQDDVRRFFNISSLRMQATLPRTYYVIHPLFIDCFNLNETNKTGVLIPELLWEALFSEVGLADPFTGCEPGFPEMDLHPHLKISFKQTDHHSNYVHSEIGPAQLHKWTLKKKLSEKSKFNLLSFLSFRSSYIRQQISAFCLEGRASQMSWSEISDVLCSPFLLEKSPFIDDSRQVPNAEYGLRIMYRMIVEYLRRNNENKPFAAKLKAFTEQRF